MGDIRNIARRFDEFKSVEVQGSTDSLRSLSIEKTGLAR